MAALASRSLPRGDEGPRTSPRLAFADETLEGGGSAGSVDPFGIGAFGSFPS